MRRIMEGSITNNVEMQYIIDELGLERPDTKFHVLYTEVSHQRNLISVPRIWNCALKITICW